MTPYEQGYVTVLVKLGADESELTTGKRVGTALLGPAFAGLSAPEGRGWDAFGHTMGKGWAGKGLGLLGGGAGGAGLGSLVALLSGGRIPVGAGALVGGGLGGLGGAITGEQIGLQKGLESGYAVPR